MAKLLLILVAVPAIYGIGVFYARLGGGLWQSVRRARPLSITGVIDMPQDRFETALATARTIIGQFAERPDMAQRERLASITYTIIESMERVEQLRLAAKEFPEPSVN